MPPLGLDSISSGSTLCSITITGVVLECVYTMKSVYYLVHKDTLQRFRWYRTLAGARIAQRQRNARLGFATRIERVYTDDKESELCVTSDGVTLTATYTIVEDTIESTIDSIVEV
jgi:hypothetical protein